MVFLAGRKFVLQDPSKPFIRGMKDRLVVMLNAEDAATSFRQGSTTCTHHALLLTMLLIVIT